MFKLSFNSTTLRHIDLFQSLNLIQSHGYDGVELTLNNTHVHPLKHSRKRFEEIRQYATDIGLPIICVAAGGPDVLGDEPYEPSFIHPDAAKRTERIDFIKRSIELTHMLNAPILNINSGILRHDVSTEQAHLFLYNAVDELLKEVGDLILVLEPEPGFFIETTSAAINFINENNSHNLRLNLDIGHVFCSETSCYNHIEKALPYCRHIHIEDIKDNIHHHEIPGEGDIDFERIIGLIKQSGYDHYVSVELHHHNAIWQRALEESRNYLLKIIKPSQKTDFGSRSRQSRVSNRRHTRVC